MPRNEICKSMMVVGYTPTITKDSWDHEIPGFRLYGTTLDEKVHGRKATSTAVSCDEMYAMVQHPNDLIGRAIGIMCRSGHRRKIYLLDNDNHSI